MAKERRSTVEHSRRRTGAPLHLQVGEVEDPTYVLRLFVGNRFASAEPESGDTNYVEGSDHDNHRVFSWSHDSPWPSVAE